MKTFTAGKVGTTRVQDTSRPTNWAPVIASKWRFANGQIILGRDALG